MFFHLSFSKNGFLNAVRLVTGLFVFCGALSQVALSQVKSNTDGITPPSIAPGSPAGAYSLSGFDNISLYNGKLNFGLPLLSVGGRGNTGYTMRIGAQKNWRIMQRRELISCNASSQCTYQTYYWVDDNWWDGPTGIRGYLPGGLVGRKIGYREASVQCSWCPARWSKTITRLTFTAADGTEYELRDTLTNGQPISNAANACATIPTPPSRGRIFMTADGTAATFISDMPIYDDYNACQPPPQTGTQPNAMILVYPNGHVFMKDGTRYRIVNGAVEWMKDRNGNQMIFGTDANGNTVITDSLNRTITVSYAWQNGSFNSYDSITYNGSGGTPRTIKVGYDFPSNQWLRPDYSSTLTWSQAFPNFNGASTTTPVGPGVQPAYVDLPDGRRYRFYYNQYGEIARVDLPTGGGMEYDWEGGFSGGVSGYNTQGVYRRVKERRVYSNIVARTIVERTTYTFGSVTLANNVTNGMTTEERWNPNNTAATTDDVLMARSCHYFYSTPEGSLSAASVAYPTDYSSAYDGKEYRTDLFALNGTTPTVTRSNVQLWQPRTSFAWVDGVDMRVTQSTSTLSDSNQVAQQIYTHDQYNNRTEVCEYDYGSGVPGALKRRTQTTYLTSLGAAPNLKIYDAIKYYNNGSGNPDPNNPNAQATVHVRSLPTSVAVFDGNGTRQSFTELEYDNYVNDTLHAPVLDCPFATGFDAANYGVNFTMRGNATCVTRYVNAGATPTLPVRTYTQFDVLGNVCKTMDAGRADGTRTTTEFTYADNFGVANGTAQVGGNLDNTPPAEVPFGLGTYAFLTKVKAGAGTTISQTAYTQYDYYTGKPVDFEDVNLVKYTYLYEDALDRLTKGIRAFGSANSKALTSITYDDANRKITTVSDQTNYWESASGTGIKACAYYDGLGRTFRQASYEGSTWAVSDTIFDALGRVAQVSNPYRFTGADPATATLPANTCTTTAYDLLGRPTTVTTPDGAAVMTQYYGTRVKVYDQANAQRISETDALGRLCKVWEVMSGGPDSIMFNGASNAGYLTSYAYDTLDNLTAVAQGGQSRSFVYDSLKRLTSATNPESGAMAYVYDPNGNLSEKTDARTTKTTFAYDALNRPTQKTYSGTTTEGINAANATPWVCYKYDSLPTAAPSGFNVGSAKGRLVAVTYGTGAVNPAESCGTYYGYDELGRVARKTQRAKVVNSLANPATTNYYDYPVTATYNRASAMTGETYPSGNMVSYGYDMAGRMTSFSGYLSGSLTPYATITQFSPSGQIERETYGTTAPLYLKQAYNKRLQLVDTRLGSVNDATSWDRGRLSLVYGNTTLGVANTRDTAAAELTVGDLQGSDTDNNGNIKRMYSFLPNGMIPQRDDYTYDLLNRIASVTDCQRQVSGSGTMTTVASQTYGYDRYGNRAITGVMGGVNGLSLAFSTTNNRITTAGYGYDSVGNLTSEPGKIYVYDAENRMVSAGSSGFYSYDGEGKRVKRTAGPNYCYVYGISGELLAEYMVALSSSATTVTLSKQYGYEGGKLLVTAEGATLKWLVQDHLGSTRMELNSSGAVANRYDYLPFGEQLYAGIRQSGGNGMYGYEPPVSSMRKRFGTYERDNETGLDFAQARYYANVQGRFTNPDEPLFDQESTDPQSWNLYAYVRNNPLGYIDPSGRTRDDLNMCQGCGRNPDEDWLKDLQRKIGQTMGTLCDCGGWKTDEDARPSSERQSHILPNADKIIRREWEALITGSEISAATIQLLDPIGITGVYAGITGGDYFGAVMSVGGLGKWSKLSKYYQTFLTANPNFGKFVGTGLMEIHHRIPQMYFRSNLFKHSADSLSNLYALPTGVHRGTVTPLWNAFRREHPNPTAAEVMRFAFEVDRQIMRNINRIGR